MKQEGSYDRALMPKESLRHGRGTLEVKMIPRPKIVDGELTIIYFGPYAYLRIWATGGEWEHDRKIPRSKYLGKAIGQTYSRLWTTIQLREYQ